MPFGHGKHDDICLKVMEETDAVGVAVMIIGGKRGSGFSVMTMDPEVIIKMPALLREMATEIEASMQGTSTQRADGGPEAGHA